VRRRTGDTGLNTYNIYFYIYTRSDRAAFGGPVLPREQDTVKVKMNLCVGRFHRIGGYQEGDGVGVDR